MAPRSVPKKNAPSMKTGGSRQLLRKGPWTVAEDAMLIEYVKKHGEGNWNAVQRNSRLMRCGKSCRLRWANHLRPNLKKGAFSPEEERLIIELHARFGNKWARMAAQLPGRTDNEIKNYWNTRLKRRQRAGLPIYPQDMNPQRHHEQQMQPTISSSSSFSSLLSSDHHHRPQNISHNPSLSMLDMTHNPLSAMNNNNSLSRSDQNRPYLFNTDNNQLQLYRDNNGGLALSLSSSSSSPDSSFSSTSTPLSFLGQDLSTPLILPSSIFGSLSFGNINPPQFLGFSYGQSDLASAAGMEIEIPSLQSPVLETTPSSSSNAKGDYMVDQSGDTKIDDYETVPKLSRGYSGLLQDLLEESQVLAQAEKPKENHQMEDEDKGKCVADYGLVEDTTMAHEESTFSFGCGDTSPGKHYDDSAIGTKANKDSVEGINPVDDDLLSLLDNFPLVVPVPNWYDEIGNDSSGKSSSFINGDVGTSDVQEVLPVPVNTSSVTSNHGSNNGSSCWNNMPDIYERLTMEHIL